MALFGELAAWRSPRSSAAQTSMVTEAALEIMFALARTGPRAPSPHVFKKATAVNVGKAPMSGDDRLDIDEYEALVRKAMPQ